MLYISWQLLLLLLLLLAITASLQVKQQGLRQERLQLVSA
jgi:hypothetical protein